MTTATQTDLFEFAQATIDDRFIDGSYTVEVDGRPIGQVIQGRYGWVSLDLCGGIQKHTSDTKEDAAELLWNPSKIKQEAS